MGILRNIYKSRIMNPHTCQPTLPTFCYSFHVSLTSILLLSWNYFKVDLIQHFIPPLDTFIIYLSQMKTFFLPPLSPPSSLLSPLPLSLPCSLLFFFLVKKPIFFFKFSILKNIFYPYFSKSMMPLIERYTIELC